MDFVIEKKLFQIYSSPMDIQSTVIKSPSLINLHYQRDFAKKVTKPKQKSRN